MLHRGRRFWSAVGFCALFLLPSLDARAEEAALQQYLRARLESLEVASSLRVDGVELAAKELLPQVYEATQFQPLWTNPQQVDELLRAIEDMRLDGLDPEDYHLERLRRLRAALQAAPDSVGAVDLDLLLTDALARVGYHAHYGKVDPERLDDTWNLQRARAGKSAAETLLELVRSPSLHAAIESLKPQHPVYRRLRDALARYREYDAAGGWGTVPAGPALELGDSDARIAAVRHRLAITEDLSRELDNGDERFDEELLAALQHFQHRHALPGGELDAQTVERMNLPPKVWIHQLRVNLERARWILPASDPTFVVVNIAAFEIYFVKDGARVWSEIVQVGREFAQTPLFRDEIQYFVLNPTWTVPPSMLAETFLPQAKKNPASLRKRGLRVYDRRGREVAPESVPWRKYQANNLPYRLTQAPGPENALGAIKFMFPNPYYIYLHDTPNQAAFDAQVRTTSGGCIRVRNPLQLAELLSADSHWNQDALDARVKRGKTESVYLTTPVPIYLLYWTAEVTQAGELRFYSDVYGRDPPVLSALDQAPRLRNKARRGAPQQ
ncbi:MAG TPA: L,D-transpeptidase family protein [Polyangiaceae bacterium]|nr:L,D-transpeptidase family protein [Polyangiaceae bacterium]